MYDQHSRLSRLSIEKARTERLKGWGTVILLIASNLITLATAVSAHLKQEKDEGAKVAYEDLSRTVKDMAKDQNKLAEDLENIHDYLKQQNNTPVILLEKDDRNMREIFSDALNKKSGNAPKELMVKPNKDNKLPDLNSDGEKDYDIPEFK